MSYNIRMGIPEMAALWNTLQNGYREGILKKTEEQLYKKWGNALKKLAEDPFYPSLQTHEIEALTKRYGINKICCKLKGRSFGSLLSDLYFCIENEIIAELSYQYI